MKRTILLVLLLSPMAASAARQSTPHDHEGMGQPGAGDTGEGRISLGLPPAMKRQQLANMRAHLEAVREIISDLGAGRFEHAARTAHQRLGLTPMMAQMCNRFANAEFRDRGLAFHHQADRMAEVFREGDPDRSLQALNETLGHCVQCHRRFRQ